MPTIRTCAIVSLALLSISPSPVWAQAPLAARPPSSGVLAVPLPPAEPFVVADIGEKVALGSAADVSTPQQPDEKPATPPHTGLATLVRDTAADFVAFPQRRSTWVILGIGGAAAALAHSADDELNARLAASRAAGRFFAPGKYVGSAGVQAGVGVGLYLVGRYLLPPEESDPKFSKSSPRTNKVSHLGLDLVRANIVAQLLTLGVKVTVRRDRPTGECCAFPSGHASTTFAVASVLERHLGYRGAWPTFVIASYVAASRLHDNRHFASDVVFGAALGMASGWTVVGRHGRSQYALVPVPTKGGVAVNLVRRTSTPAPMAMTVPPREK